jgi:hypothetical protein
MHFFPNTNRVSEFGVQNRACIMSSSAVCNGNTSLDDSGIANFPLAGCNQGESELDNFLRNGRGLACCGNRMVGA